MSVPHPDTQPHVLVVRVDEAGVHQFEIECAGVTDACRAWLECQENSCPVGDGCEDTCPDACAEHGADLDEAEAHGTRHRYIGGAHMGWGVPTDECYPTTSGEVVEAAYRIRTDWLPGRYPVLCEMDEHDEYLVLSLFPEESQ